jgi:hypothetical protein
MPAFIDRLRLATLVASALHERIASERVLEHRANRDVPQQRIGGRAVLATDLFQ